MLHYLCFHSLRKRVGEREGSSMHVTKKMNAVIDRPTNQYLLNANGNKYDGIV